MTELVSMDNTMPVAQPAAGTSITDLMSIAVERGMAPESLEKLFGLYERDQAIQAQRAFAKAMADLQAEAPVIHKNKRVDTGKYQYNFAELDFIANTIRPFLERHGLSYRFDSQVDGQVVAVKCIVTHRDGHSEATRFACPTQGMAGANAAQQTASALSYARRYALLLAFGLSTGDLDDDGMGGVISPEQVAELNDLLKQSEVSNEKFLAWLGAETVEDIPLSKFGQAQKELKRRVKK